MGKHVFLRIRVFDQTVEFKTIQMDGLSVMEESEKVGEGGGAISYLKVN